MSTLQRLDLAWQDNARCVGTPVDMFFHPILDRRSGRITRERAMQYQQVRDALKLCDECTVKTECLNMAMTTENGGTEQRHGIWGGLLPHERAELAKSMPRPRQLRPINHGAEGGYRTHQRRNETPCDECRLARSLSADARAAYAKELAVAR